MFHCNDLVLCQVEQSKLQVAGDYLFMFQFQTSRAQRKKEQTEVFELKMTVKNKNIMSIKNSINIGIKVK